MRLSGTRSRFITIQKNLVTHGIEPRTSWSISKNCDHYTTVALEQIIHNFKISLKQIMTYG
jgi:hypothetical protein